MRERLKDAAEVSPELAIVAEAEDGEQALELFATHRPQLAFLDIRMPGLTGLDVAAAIGAKCHVALHHRLRVSTRCRRSTPAPSTTC